MTYNLWRTAKAGKFEPDTETAQAPSLRVLAAETPGPPYSRHHLSTAQPLTFTTLALLAATVGGVIEIGPLLLPKSYVPLYAFGRRALYAAGAGRT